MSEKKQPLSQTDSNNLSLGHRPGDFFFPYIKQRTQAV